MHKERCNDNNGPLWLPFVNIHEVFHVKLVFVFICHALKLVTSPETEEYLRPFYKQREKREVFHCWSVGTVINLVQRERLKRVRHYDVDSIKQRRIRWAYSRGENKLIALSLNFGADETSPVGKTSHSIIDSTEIPQTTSQIFQVFQGSGGIFSGKWFDVQKCIYLLIWPLRRHFWFIEYINSTLLFYLILLCCPVSIH